MNQFSNGLKLRDFPPASDFVVRRSQAEKLKIASPGFSLFELMVVTAITAILTTVVLINFQSLRTQQEIQVAGNDMISKIREVQNFVLSGKIVNGTEAADAYEIVFTYPSSSYNIYYDISGVKTLLETVNLPQNMQVNLLTVGGNPDSSVTVRITAPYSQVLLDSVANQVLQIRLNHTRANRTKTVVVDGISGRIGLQ